VNGFGASANEKQAARWDGGPVSNIGGSVSGHRIKMLKSEISGTGKQIYPAIIGQMLIRPDVGSRQ
jgi:hypothetical protein